MKNPVHCKSGIIIIVLLLSAFFLIAISCRPEPVAPQEAYMYIVEPAPDSTISGDSVRILTYVQNFTVVDKEGQPNKAGEGHLIYYKDISVPLTSGKAAVTTEGTYVISTSTQHTWQNVKPGRHVFWVQLVNNDNTPLEPPSAVSVPVSID